MGVITRYLDPYLYLYLYTKLGVPVPDGPRRAFSADEKSSDSDGCFVPLHFISGDFELGCRSIRERPLPSLNSIPS